MSKFIIVIDEQNDFISTAFGSWEAIYAHENAVKYLTDINRDTIVIFTKDTHKKENNTTIESKKIPTHCIKENYGWKISKSLNELFNNSPYVIEKETFGSFKLPIHMVDVFDFKDDIDEIEIFGFNTDVAVISNALILRSAFPRAKISVLANLCAGTTPVNHVNALEVMKSCLIDVVYLVEYISN